MKHFNPIGFKTAIISFIIGSLFLISYAITHNMSLAFAGYSYLLAAIGINIIMVIVFLTLSITKPENKTKYLKTIGIMLLNIPIAYLYVIIVFDYLKI